MSFDHIFFPSGARAYLLLFPRSKEFKQLPHHSMRPFVPFARPNASQQELVAKRENVFKIFPLEISTVSRPRVRIKKSTKRRERFEFYGVGIDAREPRSDVPIAHQNRNSFPSTSNARASVKKSKGRSKKTHRRSRSGWLFRFRRNVPFRLYNQRSSLVVGRLGDLRNHASG